MSATASNDRDRTIERIRKLLALAADRAATPAEAERAAEMASRLIREHGVSLDDLAASDMEEAAVDLGRTKRSGVDALIDAVAYATGTVPLLYGRPGRSTEVRYFGAAPAPEIAVYLHAIVYRAVVTATDDFKRSAEYRRRRTTRTRRRAVEVFKAGMIARLRVKLAALGWMSRDDLLRLQRMQASRYAGAVRGVAPLKRRNAAARYSDAHDAGRSAGSAVAIERGVSAATTPIAGLLCGAGQGMLASVVIMENDAS